MEEESDQYRFCTGTGFLINKTIINLVHVSVGYYELVIKKITLQMLCNTDRYLFRLVYDLLLLM